MKPDPEARSVRVKQHSFGHASQSHNRTRTQEPKSNKQSAQLDCAFKQASGKSGQSTRNTGGGRGGAGASYRAMQSLSHRRGTWRTCWAGCSFVALASWRGPHHTCSKSAVSRVPRLARKLNVQSKVQHNEKNAKETKKMSDSSSCILVLQVARERTQTSSETQDRKYHCWYLR